MRIAYVTRPTGPQGRLNGEWSVVDYLSTRYPMYVVEAGPLLGDSPSPEASDLSGYPDLSRVDWSSFDLVLYGNYGFAPFFWAHGIDATLVAHTHWAWADEAGTAFQRFLPFVTSAVCSTAEVLGLFRGAAPHVVARFAPFPVSSDLFAGGPAWEDRARAVTWIGRPDEGKNDQELRRIARALPGVVFEAWSPIPFQWSEPNVVFRIGEARSACVEAIRAARTLLVTSRYETYGVALIEGGLAGASVVARDVFGLRHALPGTWLYQTEVEAVSLLREDVRPRAGVDFWRTAYTDEAWSRWDAFIGGGV